MNNLLSYCGLVDASISSSKKYLPVHIVGVENVVSRFSDESYSGLLAPKKAVEESVIHSKSGQHPWLGSPYVTLKLKREFHSEIINEF